MEHQGDFGGNLGRQSNPLGQFTPSFPAPATNGGGAWASQAAFQANGSERFITGEGMPWPGHPGANALAPPAVAPQAFQPDSHHLYWTMPQQSGGAPNASPFQHFGAAGAGAAVQPPPLHGEELAARVAAININILASQPFHQHNNGWQQQQQQPAPPPVGANGYGATGWAPPVPHPGGWPTSWAAPPPVQQQPGGDTSWASPPMQQQSGGVQTMSWAAPASGSAHQAASPATGKTLEEFLMDVGVLDDGTVDEILVNDLIKELMANEGTAESGPVQQPDGPTVGLGGYGLPPPSSPAASYSYTGPSRDQAGLNMMRGEEEPASSRRDPVAAAEARARRGRRMAKRKEAIAARARSGN